MMNAFNRELLRLWEPITIENAQQNCIPSHAAGTLQKMQTWLNTASEFIPDADHYQGELYCLKGDIQLAKEIWRGNSEHPFSALFAAIISFSRNEFVETPFAAEIGVFGFLNGSKRQLDGNITEAISWYRFSLMYAPTIYKANRLERMYHLQGDREKAENLWIELTRTVSPDIPLYWWAKGKESEGEGENSIAGEYFYLAAARAALQAQPIDAYRSYIAAGQTWFYSEDYDRAEDAFQKALETKLEYLYANLPESLPYPYLWLGRATRAQLKYEIALDYFSLEVTINPTNSAALYEKAITLDALGRRQESIDALTAAIANHPSPPESWINLLAEWNK